jgi:Tol biopolymer transport system component
MQVLVCYLEAIEKTSNTVIPKGYVVYSRFIGRWLPQNTSARYDLFLVKTNKKDDLIRLTSESSKIGNALWYPIISPDGKQVLFKAGFSNNLDLLDAEIYQPLFSLETINISTKHLQNIPDKSNYYKHPCWSLDSKYIGMSSPSKLSGMDSDESIPDDIFICNRSKSTVKKVARVQGYVSDLFWSLDGKNLLFQLWSFEGTQDSSLYTVPKTGGKPKVFVKGKGDRFGYSFSPNGRNLAFIQDNAIYIAKPDGSNQLHVIACAERRQSRERLKPKWSIKGDKLAFADVVWNTVDKKHNTTLHVYSSLDGKDKIVAIIPEKVTDVIWSRDGQWLITKIVRVGETVEPDIKTGGYTFRYDGLLAVAISDGSIVTLKNPDEETKGLDWYEMVE